MGNAYQAIGLMSGSSLDGLDIACCNFNYTNNQWQFEIQHADVIAYPDDWVLRLKQLPIADAKALAHAHAALGAYFGQQVDAFIKRYALNKIDVIASHGHTIFHFPHKGFTTQIADGAAIAFATGITTACDFRTSDIAAGGQGTPIVPIGDLHLFGDYRFCLNIGGIANISCKTKNGIVAFDICAANQILNTLAGELGKEYDDAGTLARSGKLNNRLLTELEALPFCTKKYPKSLDNSYSRDMVFPVIEKQSFTTEDKLYTYTEHIAMQVAAHIKMINTREGIPSDASDKLLVTGGGAFNTYLLERIKHHAQLTVEVPDDKIIKFKEALVIAFMGVLRMRNEVNVLKTVTGAQRDTVGGALYI